MFGARRQRLLKPLTKNLWLITMTTAVSSCCSRPAATVFAAKNGGSGQPNIVCPMETYISSSQKPSEANSRFLSAAVSRSCCSSPPDAEGAALPAGAFFSAAS